MIVGIADTHTVIWYLADAPKLSRAADAFIEAADNNGDWIGISSITLIEMVYLIEKGKIAAENFSILTRILSERVSVFVEIKIDIDIARTLSRIDSSQVPDMPDRIIAATAPHLNVPIISKDAKIQASGLKTMW